MAETWMVAHDFSPCSDAALLEAARLLSPLRGTLHVLHIHAPVDGPTHLQWGEQTFELANDLRARMERMATVVKEAHPGCTLKVNVASGDPLRTILSEADRLDVDHIVVGTHGKTGLTHLVLGSVAERVVKEAKVPVLVVKERATR